MDSKSFSEEKTGRNYMQWINAMLANSTMFVYGLLCGWVSPMTKLLQSEHSPIGYPLSDGEISWIASIFSLSAIFSTWMFTFLVDRFGRKPGLLLISVSQTICCIGTIFAKSGLTLVIARVFSGVAAAGCYNCVSIYIKEISEDTIRGKLSALFTLYQTTGYLAMYAMGAYLDYYLVIYITTAVSILTGLSLLMVPESPPFLIKLGKYDQAAATIANLRRLDVQDKYVQNELTVLTAKANEYNSLPKIQFFKLLSDKAMRRGFIYTWILVSASAASGNFAILSYASDILKASGVTFSPEVQAMMIPTVMILGSLMSVVFIEKIGRKIILISTFFISAVSMALLGTIIYLQQQGNSVPGWFAMLCIISFEIGYAGGVSSMPFIIISEMFSFEVRARINGLLATNGWTLSFVILIIYHPISNAFGAFISFYLYAAINFVGMVFALFFVPETKAKSVDQIQDEMTNRIIILPTRKYYKS